MTITLPSKQRLTEVIRQHAEENAGLFSIFLRLLLYCAGMLSACFLAENFFCDTYAANLCIFFLFAVGIELFWNLPKAALFSGRVLCYIIVVIGIIISGSALVHQGKCCQACASAYKSNR